MMPTQKKILAVSGLVLVIAISSVWILRGLSASHPAPEHPSQEWQCAQCGALFRAEMPAEYLRPRGGPGEGMNLPRCKCPKCGSSAHLRQMMRCAGCSTVFVFSQAYLEPDSSSARSAVRLRCVNPACTRFLPKLLIRRPDGQWTRLKCEACGRTFDALEPPSGAAPPAWRCLDEACGSDRVVLVE